MAFPVFLLSGQFYALYQNYILSVDGSFIRQPEGLILRRVQK